MWLDGGHGEEWRLRCPDKHVYNVGFKYPLLYSQFLEQNLKEVCFITTRDYFSVPSWDHEGQRHHWGEVRLDQGEKKKHKLWDDRTSWKQAGQCGLIIRLNVKFLLIIPPCSEKNRNKKKSVQGVRSDERMQNIVWVLIWQFNIFLFQIKLAKFGCFSIKLIFISLFIYSLARHIKGDFIMFCLSPIK